MNYFPAVAVWSVKIVSKTVDFSSVYFYALQKCRLYVNSHM